MRTALFLSGVLLLQQLPSEPPQVLPALAVAQLQKSLEASKPQARHVWRDVAPINPDGTINAYIEIARGDRRKWELHMARNQRAIDRVMPDYPGGYPINYGIVPQTVSYDGDPFDVLVTGAPIEGGRLVRGVIVGLMHMEDEKGLDSKVVISRVDANGGPVGTLTIADRQRVGAFFNVYKLHEPGEFSRVPGWGTAAQGLAFVTTTHAFFRECRSTPAGSACTPPARR